MQRFPVAEAQAGTNLPPMHPHCRSTTMPDTSDATLRKIKRFARDPATGKGITVPGNMSYQEWYGKYVAGDAQGNATQYSQREEKQWRFLEESKPKRPYPETAIAPEIKQPSYRRKLDRLGENAETSRSIWQEATQMLKHRSGTKFEDLTFINSRTGESRTQSEYNVEYECVPTKSMKRMLRNSNPYTIIAVHNHPNSSVPSIADLRAARDGRYKYGVIVGHNGIVFRYSVQRGTNLNFADILLDILQNELYTENISDSRIERVLMQLSECGINLGVFR
jgi:hypothetical protein